MAQMHNQEVMSQIAEIQHVTVSFNRKEDALKREEASQTHLL